MTDFVLPSQADMRAIDLSTLSISDEDPGLMTTWYGAILINLVNQMAEGEIIHIRGTNSSTGKTEKFILENAADLDTVSTIVTTDYFTNMIWRTQDFNTIINNSDRVYRNWLNPWRVAPDAANTSPVVSADINPQMKNAPSDSAVTIDLTTTPPAMSDANVLAQSLDANINPAIVTNANGTALGAADDDFVPQLGVSFAVDTNKGYQAWDDRRKLMEIPSIYNNLPVNGVLLVLNYTLNSVQTAVTRLVGALDGASKTYQMVTYSPVDGQAANAVAIKKLSA